MRNFQNFVLFYNDNLSKTANLQLTKRTSASRNVARLKVLEGKFLKY